MSCPSTALLRTELKSVLGALGSYMGPLRVHSPEANTKQSLNPNSLVGQCRTLRGLRSRAWAST